MRRLVKVLGWGVLVWAGWRLFGPDRRPRFEGPQVRPLKIPGRTVFVGERENFVRETGNLEGPTLVLLHGLAFDGEMTFYKLIPLLADRYRLVIPDHRAQGRSERARGPVEMADLADDLAGVLDELGLQRVNLMGYSMGGMVAQEFAHRHPGRVDRLVLAATAAHPIDRARPAVRSLMWGMRAPVRLSRHEQILVNYRVMTRTGALEPQHRRWMWDAMMSRDPSLYFEALGAIWRFDSRGWVARLDAPVLQLITTTDVVVPTRTQRRLSELLADPTVAQIYGGHEAILTQPEAFARAIAGFVRA